jgi:hypothetical protein
VAKTTRVGSLEVGQDLAFQQREWKVQRAAWVVALLILVAGFAGLLGGGPLSQTEASSGPLALEYDRFARQRSPAALTIRVDPGVAVDGEIPIWLDRAFLEKVDVEHIMPEPTTMEVGSDRVIYRFAVETPEQPAEITFAIQPHEPGVARGWLGLVDGADIAFDQVIYP